LPSRDDLGRLLRKPLDRELEQLVPQSPDRVVGTAAGFDITPPPLDQPRTQVFGVQRHEWQACQEAVGRTGRAAGQIISRLTPRLVDQLAVLLLGKIVQRLFQRD